MDSRRYGKPRSDAERRKRHTSRFGSSTLPKRGTGRKMTAEAIKRKFGGV